MILILKYQKVIKMSRVIFILLLFSSLLVAKLATDEELNKFSVIDLNKGFAETSMKKCPIVIDNVTRLLSYKAYGMTVIIKIEIATYKITNSIDYMKNYMFPIDTKRICSNRIWGNTVRRGGIIKFKYVDTNNKYLFSYSINKETCNF